MQVSAKIATTEPAIATERAAADREVAIEKLALDLDIIAEQASPVYADAGRRLVSALETIHFHYETAEMSCCVRSFLELRIEISLHRRSPRRLPGDDPVRCARCLAGRLLCLALAPGEPALGRQPSARQRHQAGPSRHQRTLRGPRIHVELKAMGREAEIGLTHDANDERRLKLHHHVLRHRHDIRPSLARCREHYDRARLQQLVNL